jgi:hypothetical protein
MADEKKLSGGKAMDELASKLVRVPKKELDRQVRRYRAAKKRRKKS